MADDLHARVAGRLRSLRQAQGRTLADVAAVASMDPSALSRLESGARRLSLDHLPVLADALRVSVDTLLRPETRTGARLLGDMELVPLTVEGAPQAAYRVRLPAARREPEPRTHPGRQWLHVLRGRVRLVLGEEDLVLVPGQAIDFSTEVPHWMGAVDGPAELISLFGPRGERVELLTAEAAVRRGTEHG